MYVLGLGFNQLFLCVPLLYTYPLHILLYIGGKLLLLCDRTCAAERIKRWGSIKYLIISHPLHDTPCCSAWCIGCPFIRLLWGFYSAEEINSHNTKRGNPFSRAVRQNNFRGISWTHSPLWSCACTVCSPVRLFQIQSHDFVRGGSEWKIPDCTYRKTPPQSSLVWLSYMSKSEKHRL